MKPFTGRITGKVDFYAAEWSQRKGQRMKMWIEETEEGVMDRGQV